MDDQQQKIVLGVILAAATLLFLRRLLRAPRPTPALHSVAILVLGDVGRSPRMMYHAESFAYSGFETFLIGYRGSKPVPSLLSSPLVRFTYLPEPPALLSSLPFILLAPLKIVHQVTSILHTLLIRIPRPPEFILVQNPPSIPTLVLVALVARLRGCKVIIDWHNLGYTILALKLGPSHPFVCVAKRFEATFGRSAYAHLFVTDAMRKRLVSEWDLQGQKAVLHDRPPSHFHRTTPNEIHELFLRLQPTLRTSPFTSPSLPAFLPAYDPPQATPLTQLSTHRFAPEFDDLPSPPPSVPEPTLRPDRPALLVSSTSWTPDEDFSILLSALSLYEERAAQAQGQLPKVLCIVTGKGPEREKYMRQIRRLQEGTPGNGGHEGGWKYVRCVSLWLEAADYPLLLGSADVGISLHTSSSALDLPMKVVDMFGCGLPVCALNFACLDELVKDGVNGLVFSDAEQLADQLANLLTGFPKRTPTLQKLRQNLTRPAEVPTHHGTVVPGWEWGTWSDNWERVVKPLVTS